MRHVAVLKRLVNIVSEGESDEESDEITFFY